MPRDYALKVKVDFPSIDCFGHRLCSRMSLSRPQCACPLRPNERVRLQLQLARGILMSLDHVGAFSQRISLLSFRAKTPHEDQSCEGRNRESFPRADTWMSTICLRVFAQVPGGVVFEVQSGQDRASSSCLSSTAKQRLVQWNHCLVKHHF
jgi:hypothetical protein